MAAGRDHRHYPEYRLLFTANNIFGAGTKGLLYIEEKIDIEDKVTWEPLERCQYVPVVENRAQRAKVTLMRHGLHLENHRLIQRREPTDWTFINAALEVPLAVMKRVHCRWNIRITFPHRPCAPQ